MTIKHECSNFFSDDKQKKEFALLSGALWFFALEVHAVITLTTGGDLSWLIFPLAAAVQAASAISAVKNGLQDM